MRCRTIWEAIVGRKGLFGVSSSSLGLANKCWFNSAIAKRPPLKTISSRRCIRPPPPPDHSIAAAPFHCSQLPLEVPHRSIAVACRATPLGLLQRWTRTATSLRRPNHLALTMHITDSTLFAAIAPAGPVADATVPFCWSLMMQTRPFAVFWRG